MSNASTKRSHGSHVDCKAIRRLFDPIGFAARDGARNRSTSELNRQRFSEQRSHQFPTENQWPMGPTTSNYHYKSPENVLDAVGSHWDYWSPGMMMWVTSRDEMGFYVTNDRDLVKVGRKFELSINLLLVLTNRWRFWPIIGDDDWWRGTTRWSLTAGPNLTPVLLMNPCTGIMVHDWVRSKKSCHVKKSEL